MVSSLATLFCCSELRASQCQGRGRVFALSLPSFFRLHRIFFSTSSFTCLKRRGFCFGFRRPSSRSEFLSHRGLPRGTNAFLSFPLRLCAPKSSTLDDTKLAVSCRESDYLGSEKEKGRTGSGVEASSLFLPSFFNTSLGSPPCLVHYYGLQVLLCASALLSTRLSLEI